MNSSRIEQTLNLVKKAGILRPRDLAAHGLPRTHLQRLCEQGLLERISYGLYRVVVAGLTEKQSLAETARRVPDGVLCLLTALQFHELTTQSPHEVWVAVRAKAWRPKAGTVPLRIFHLSGPAFEHGVEAHEVGGVTLRVYSAAKTVADCFKFRSKVGLDVALEALRDYRKRNSGGMDALWRSAAVCRMTNVMKPYLEATAWAGHAPAAVASVPPGPTAPSAR
jgi:predicted transcriptional regulator of viral defense system